MEKQDGKPDQNGERGQRELIRKEKLLEGDPMRDAVVRNQVDTTELSDPYLFAV